MRKTSQTQPQFSPYISSPIGYVRPEMPMNAVPSQNQYQMMRTLETSAD
jgi:hypothetical protein